MLIVNNWWALVFRGILGVIVGILSFIWPGITVGGLVLLFGAYALVDGVLHLAGAWRRSHEHRPWGVTLIEGFVGIFAGIVTFLWPGITALTLVMFIGIWAIITGVLEIAAAIRLRKLIRNEWLLALTGIASLVFGVAVLAAPLAGALVIAIWFGAYALVFGILMIALGFNLRRFTAGAFHPAHSTV